MKAGEVKAGTVCPAVEQVPLVRARHSVASVDGCFTRNDGDGDNDDDGDGDNDGDEKRRGEARRERGCLIGDS